MKPKNASIEDLARMVQDGFAENQLQFKEIRHEIAGFRSEVDERFTQVHQELRSIRKELEGVVYRPEFEALQDQVRDLQRMLGTLKKKTA